MAKTIIIPILAIALVVTISLQQVEGGVYDILQVIPCTDGQVRKYESTTDTWDCADDLTGSGTPRETLVSHWDQSITKTNIGTSFINVYNQANSDGKSIYIDTNGMSTIRIQILWNKIGTGTQTIQVIEDGTANVLVSLNVVSGSNDSGLVDIPAALESSVKQYVIQAKSTTSTDDPIFEGARIWLKS